MAYYYAIAIATAAGSGSTAPATPAALTRIFADFTGLKSQVWYTFRKGTMPGAGSYRKPSSRRLADVLAERFPGALGMRDHPLWQLIDKTPIDLATVQAHVVRLMSPSRREQRFDPDWFLGCRCLDSPLDDLKRVILLPSVDGCAALVALLLEAQLLREVDRYRQIRPLLPGCLLELYEDPVLQPLAPRLSAHVLGIFKEGWSPDSVWWLDIELPSGTDLTLTCDSGAGKA